MYGQDIKVGQAVNVGQWVQQGQYRNGKLVMAPVYAGVLPARVTAVGADCDKRTRGTVTIEYAGGSVAEVQAALVHPVPVQYAKMTRCLRKSK